MVDVEDRVVVGGDDAGYLLLIKAQVGAPGMCPPGIERGRVKIGTVPVVV
jgi:hypothetical protein